jgi:Y-X(10)_GDL-associated radical SAM protein
MDQSFPIPARQRRPDDFHNLVPVHVVWEITLACNLKCQHCGSRAGRPRTDELTTAESLDLIDQLARLGTRELTLIGGEAYLRPDWIDLIRRAKSHGMFTGIQTGGRNLTDRRLDAAVAAGLDTLGVSIDGPPEVHDRLRGVPGSYDQAIDALRRAKAGGLRVSANTQICSESLDHMPEVMDSIIEAGATHWQIQLTVAMGNAVENDGLLLQPYQILDVMPMLSRLYKQGVERGLLMTVGNNIGYFGPYEHLWRGLGDETLHWGGCGAGQTVIGIEANGALKGCPSLATVDYTAGNVRTASVEDIWRYAERMRFGRLGSIDELWGYCRTCYYADLCRGGCTWTFQSLLGRRGNNPYCHHRTLDLARHGLRERIVKVKDAPPDSFACGEFALITEPMPGVTDAPPLPVRDPAAVHIHGDVGQPEAARLAPSLTLCRGCHRYVWPHETECPHCGADIATEAARHEDEAAHRRALMAEISALVEQAKAGRLVPAGD